MTLSEKGHHFATPVNRTISAPLAEPAVGRGDGRTGFEDLQKSAAFRVIDEVFRHHHFRQLPSRNVPGTIFSTFGLGSKHGHTSELRKKKNAQSKGMEEIISI
ncbi:hypothetical protein HF690_05595 [Oleiagrimonas citrea]|uniref:Uncharacterized protein n=1 Tax=Oleiagrimonas citrea TaxID=1665687 RepID=A0A846ZLM0_9GAMM|nr:hypothetical protein [Oleiagrimonas citrea]NKZ38430.1 hypothetical protein [Oleiagrimonas citrea]